jgi:hypothetical protein
MSIRAILMGLAPANELGGLNIHKNGLTPLFFYLRAAYLCFAHPVIKFWWEGVPIQEGSPEIMIIVPPEPGHSSDFFICCHGLRSTLFKRAKFYRADFRMRLARYA